MVGAEQPPSPELRPEGVAEYEDGEAPAGGGDAGTQQPGRTLQSPGWGPARVGRGPSSLRSLQCGGWRRMEWVAWVLRVRPGVGPEIEKTVGGLSRGAEGAWAPRWAEPECGCDGWEA